MKNLNIIVTISLLTSNMLLGAPNIGDINRQIEAPKDLPKKSTPLVEVDGIKKYKEPMQDDKSGKKIYIKDFKIENAIHLDETYLKNLISSYSNKDLTFNELQEITSTFNSPAIFSAIALVTGPAIVTGKQIGRAHV